MKVTVLQEDLDAGLTRSYTHDAVCRAIRRTIHKKFNVTRSFQVMIPNRDYVFIDGAKFDLPEPAQRLIALIDAKRAVQPITFELDDLPSDFFNNQQPSRR